MSLTAQQTDYLDKLVKVVDNLPALYKKYGLKPCRLHIEPKDNKCCVLGIFNKEHPGMLDNPLRPCVGALGLAFDGNHQVNPNFGEWDNTLVELGLKARALCPPV